MPNRPREPQCRCPLPTEYRLRHSLWMIPALLGFGALSWVSFVYLAARMRTRGTVAAAVGLVVAGTLGAFYPGSSSTSGGILVFTWAAGIVLAIILNPAYHRHRWIAEGHRCAATGTDSAPGWVDLRAPEGAEPLDGAPRDPREAAGMPLVEDVMRANRLAKEARQRPPERRGR